MSQRFGQQLHRALLTLSSLAMIVFAVGCGNAIVEPQSGAIGADTPVEVHFDLAEFSIDTPLTTFETGVPYRFIIENTGMIAHDFRITERGEAESMVNMHVPGETHVHGTELMLIHEPELEPGAVVTKDITFMRPGKFEIACHVAGHLQAGMYNPIVVEGETLAEPTPIDLASITYDADSMKGMPCHAMGVTIMGDCTPEDVDRITAELLGATGAVADDHMDDEMESDGHMHEPGEADDHAGDDSMMTSDDGMMELMSDDMMANMGSMIMFDFSSRRDEPCQVVDSNRIIGACSPEDVARLVEELMATLNSEEMVPEADTIGAVESPGVDGGAEPAESGEGQTEDEDGHEEGESDDHSHDEGSDGG